MDPQVFARQLRKPEGEAGISMGKTMNEGNLKMHEHFLEMLKADNGDHILEIGFGNGKFIPEILNKAENIHYSGIDFSDVMVAESDKLIRQEGLEKQAEVALGSISNIQFPDNSFHKVITINTIYFWPTPQDDIKEIWRVLKDGGEFYLCFRPKEMAEKLPVTKFGFVLYSLEEAMMLIKSAGFRELSYSYKEEPEVEMFGNKIVFSSYCIKALK